MFTERNPSKSNQYTEEFKMKQLCLLLLIVLALAGCSKPTSYYTSPHSAGFNQQALGGICDFCEKQFNLSGNQLLNVPRIKCPYCSHMSNTKNAAAQWVSVKNQRHQQVNQQLMLGIVQGAAAGMNSYNANHYPVSTPTVDLQIM